MRRSTRTAFISDPLMRPASDLLDHLMCASSEGQEAELIDLYNRKSLTFDEAAAVLDDCHRQTLKDRHFGDREVTWVDDRGETIAVGYYGQCGYELSVCGTNFDGEHAYRLEDCYKTQKTEFQGSRE